VRESGRMSGKNTIEDVSLPMPDVLKFSILNSRIYTIEAMREYDKLAGQNKAPPTHVIRSCVMALFREISSAMEKDYNKLKREDEFISIQQKVKSRSYEDLEEAFIFIDRWLYKKEVTRFDTNKRYDKSRASVEDRLRGLE
jgi:hypothetical protein